MQSFFIEPLRLWPAGEAAIGRVELSSTWPPQIVATGLVPCIRAWTPSHSDHQSTSAEEASSLSAEFHPVESLRELDGTRKTALVLHGSLLIIADSSDQGLISIFDTNAWKITHTMKAGAPVTALKTNSKYLAAATSKGRIHTWLLPQPSPDGFIPSTSPSTSPSLLGKEDLERVGISEGFQVDPDSPLDEPCTTLALGTMPNDSHVLIALSPLGCKMNLWRLPDGKLVQSMAQQVTKENALSKAIRANVTFSFCDGPMFATISYLAGHDPVVTVMDLISRCEPVMSRVIGVTLGLPHLSCRFICRHAQDVEAPERLVGRGRPTSCCFNGGKILAIGFEDGAVAAFGMHGWLGYHQGAQVRCIRVLPDRLQVLSGGSDNKVKLWSAQGVLLSTIDLGFQVTALSGGSEGGVVAAGGNKGEVQLLILPPHPLAPVPAESASTSTSTSTSTSASASPLDAAVKISNEEKKEEEEEEKRVDYDLFFDSRPCSDPSVVKASGRTVDHLQAYESFMGCNGAFTRKGVTAEAVMSHALRHGVKPRTPEEVKKAEEALTEAARKKQIEQMGEDQGVARTPGLSGTCLDSSTARSFGRKCSNPSCMIREGIAELKGKTFKRCSACKSVFYCSVHCQRTHFRDVHRKECLALAASLKALELKQKEEEKAEEAEELNHLPPDAAPDPPPSPLLTTTPPPPITPTSPATETEAGSHGLYDLD